MRFALVIETFNALSDPVTIRREHATREAALADFVTWLREEMDAEGAGELDPKDEWALKKFAKDYFDGFPEKEGPHAWYIVDAEEEALRASPIYTAVYHIRNFLVGDEEDTRIADPENRELIPTDKLEEFDHAVASKWWTVAIKILVKHVLKDATVEQVKRVADLVATDLWDLTGDESDEDRAEILEYRRDDAADAVATFEDWLNKP